MAGGGVPGGSGGGGRLAVLGGTFDPVHIGHLVVAQDVLEALGLDRLLVVPAGEPPHREACFPAPRRLAWVREAFAGDDRIEVDDREVRRSGPSWTVDTLEEVARDLSPDALFCVIGVDQLRVLDEWREPERIARLSTLTVMTREGEDPADLRPGVPVPFEVVPVTRVDLSSTRIRRRLEKGRTVRYLVPEAIREDVEAAARG